MILAGLVLDEEHQILQLRSKLLGDIIERVGHQLLETFRAHLYRHALALRPIADRMGSRRIGKIQSNFVVTPSNMPGKNAFVVR